MIGMGGISCNPTDGGEREHTNDAVSFALPPDALEQAMLDITQVMINDIFSPPQAGRTYAYCGLAAWEAFSGLSSSAQPTLRLQDYSGIPRNALLVEGGTRPDPALSAVLAYYGMAAELLFSEDRVRQSSEAFRDRYANRYSEEQWSASAAYADRVLAALRPYRDSDGYLSTRSLPRYPLRQEDGFWVPTAPGYMDAIEPNWRLLRPFFMDSATQFVPAAPVPYSSRPSSVFYRDMVEVYETSLQLSDEQQLIANFWDCNPFFLEIQGHFNYSSKKISPGAHWMGIAAAVCDDAGLDFGTALWVQTVLGCTLQDAFISCWDEKYRSEYVRPETVINELLDPDWKPLLQTPPFPEYTSGHSVVSNASAIVLNALLGERSFIDSVEVPFGLPPRSFSGFQQAADEATISRLYGGIHFRPAVEVGAIQGKAVGAQAVQFAGLRRVEEAAYDEVVQK